MFLLIHPWCLRVLLTGLFLWSAVPFVRAEVKLPALISDHMVLQQEWPAAVWGWAEPGEKIAVSFNGQQRSTIAAANGKWLVRLEPMRSGGPFEMMISGRNTIDLKDVVVGEVWVCSGQSNMEWPVSRAANPEQEISQANFPRIRLFTIKHAVSEKAMEDFSGAWETTSPETIKQFSAVGYFFGRELHRQSNRPIGLIHSSWGGTPAEAWTSESTLKTDLSLQPILWQWKRTLADYLGSRQRYERQLKEWAEMEALAKTQGKQISQRPAEPRGPGHPWTPSGLFNAMIAPMTCFGIRGVIWYQGESNAQPYRSMEYRRLFASLINDWRRAWDQGPFPFLFVQLANFMERKSEPSESAWAELREAQTMALSLPNTGMTVAIDIGEANDIHPRNKQEVGRRLALAARAIAYGENIAYSGPVYKGMSIEGPRIRLRFHHLGKAKGLLVQEGSELKGFAIAGRDRKFVWADAHIEADTVVVSSPNISNPVAVRYAWADNPACNLYSKEGLPASPFRTDDWPGAEVSGKQ